MRLGFLKDSMQKLIVILIQEPLVQYTEDFLE